MPPHCSPWLFRGRWGKRRSSGTSPPSSCSRAVGRSSWVRPPSPSRCGPWSRAGPRRSVAAPIATASWASSFCSSRWSEPNTTRRPTSTVWSRERSTSFRACPRCPCPVWSPSSCSWSRSLPGSESSTLSRPGVLRQRFASTAAAGLFASSPWSHFSPTGRTPHSAVRTGSCGWSGEDHGSSGARSCPDCWRSRPGSSSSSRGGHVTHGDGWRSQPSLCSLRSRPSWSPLPCSHAAPNDDFYPQTPALRYLARHLDGERFAAPGEMLFQSTNSYYELRSVTGHSFAPPAWRDLIVSTSPRTYNYPTQTVLADNLEVATSPVLDQLSARYFVDSADRAPFGRIEPAPPATGTAVLERRARRDRDGRPRPAPRGRPDHRRSRAAPGHRRVPGRDTA